MHIVILGGGACGMMAAWELCARGAQVTVLERERRPGGLCGTIEDGGFHFDLGGHRVISQNRELVARLEALLGDEFLRRVRSSVILNRGEQFRYPLQAGELLRKVPLTEAAAVWASYSREALRRRLRPEADASFEDWVVHRFGRALYDRFFGPYTEKLWGIAPTEISSDWAAQRISLLDLTDVLLRLLGLRQGGARTYAKRYLYPRRGIGQLFTRMAEEITALGGRIVYGQLFTPPSGIQVASLLLFTHLSGKSVATGLFSTPPSGIQVGGTLFFTQLSGRSVANLLFFTQLSGKSVARRRAPSSSARATDLFASRSGGSWRTRLGQRSTGLR